MLACATTLNHAREICQTLRFRHKRGRQSHSKVFNLRRDGLIDIEGGEIPLRLLSNFIVRRSNDKRCCSASSVTFIGAASASVCSHARASVGLVMGVQPRS